MPRDLRALQLWISTISVADVFEVPWDGKEGTELLESVTMAAGHASDAMRWAYPHHANLVWVLQYALAEAIWNEGLDVGRRVVAVGALPALLKAACNFDECSLPAFQFWESILIPWERDHAAQRAHAVIHAVADALLVQLSRATTDCERLSALHGVNHLRDERVATEALGFEGGFSPEVADYAARATRFAAP